MFSKDVISNSSFTPIFLNPTNLSVSFLLPRKYSRELRVTPVLPGSLMSPIVLRLSKLSERISPLGHIVLSERPDLVCVPTGYGLIPKGCGISLLVSLLVSVIFKNSISSSPPPTFSPYPISPYFKCLFFLGFLVISCVTSSTSISI